MIEKQKNGFEKIKVQHKLLDKVIEDAIKKAKKDTGNEYD